MLDSKNALQKRKRESLEKEGGICVGCPASTETWPLPQNHHSTDRVVRRAAVDKNNGGRNR